MLGRIDVAAAIWIRASSICPRSCATASATGSGATLGSSALWSSQSAVAELLEQFVSVQGGGVGLTLE
ncbi:MAG: hypothetical protein HC927_00270 [Deltaproteobacteria bacterium]|nr:hypothetical protein [Deltaproteobacteria bacterium]